MGRLITDVISFFNIYAERIFLAATVITIAEYLLPQSRYSLVSRIRGAIFWSVYIVITSVGLTLFARLWAALGMKPLMHLDLRLLSSSSIDFLAVAGGATAAWMTLQIAEFFYYWFHRLQHTVAFLWKFHAVHHSLEEMSAFNSNHHFTEELFRIPFITIPLSLLFSFEQGYVPWLWAFLLGWQGIYEHSATRIHLGWFRYIIPDNRFHRIHHSIENHHHGKNFGSGSAIWDIVFGTIHYPKRNEWPNVGLEDIREPVAIKDFLFRPFRSNEARR